VTRWHSGSAWLALCARAGYATRGRSAGQRAHPPEGMVGRAGAAAADDGLPAAAAAAGDVPAGPAAGLPAGPAAGPVPGHAADGPLAGRAGRRQGPLKAERSARCRECHAGVQRWAWRAAAGASVPLPVLVVQESGRAGQLQSQPAGYMTRAGLARACQDQLRRRAKTSCVVVHARNKRDPCQLLKGRTRAQCQAFILGPFSRVCLVLCQVGVLVLGLGFLYGSHCAWLSQ